MSPPFARRQGKSAEDAKKLFCRVWAEVHADSKTNLRVW